MEMRSLGGHGKDVSRRIIMKLLGRRNSPKGAGREKKNQKHVSRSSSLGGNLRKASAKIIKNV